MAHSVVFVTSDADWQGLYINGELASQNHTISVDDALSLVSELSGPFTYTKLYDENGHYVDTFGCYPDNLEELDS